MCNLGWRSLVNSLYLNKRIKTSFIFKLAWCLLSHILELLPVLLILSLLYTDHVFLLSSNVQRQEFPFGKLTCASITCFKEWKLDTQSFHLLGNKVRRGNKFHRVRSVQEQVSHVLFPNSCFKIADGSVVPVGLWDDFLKDFAAYLWIWVSLKVFSFSPSW